jgi:replication-associated recombination protein RarA
VSEGKAGDRRFDPPRTRHGHNVHEVISALQKAIRRSQAEAAAAWAIELAVSGHGAWAFSRMRTIAIEDCSPENTGLVADVRALAEQWKESKNRSEGGDLLAVAAAAVRLAIAEKSRVVNWLVLLYGSENAPPLVVPDEALDQHTLRGRRMGRGRAHFVHEAARTIPWTGDLAELEADVATRAERSRAGEQMTIEGEHR